LAPRPEPITPGTASKVGETLREAIPVTIELASANSADLGRARVASAPIDDKTPPQSGSAVPAGIPPKQDAGIDAIVALPPVPDAALIRDSGVPMQ